MNVNPSHDFANLHLVRRRFVIGFAILFVTTASAFATSYLESAKVIEIERTIDTIYDYVGELRSTVSTFKDVETRVQDYVISPESRSLDSYQTAVTAASMHMKRLKVLSSYDSARKGSIAALEQELAVFLNQSEQLMQTRINEGIEPSQVRAREYGLEEVRLQAEDLEEREIGLLQKYMRQSEHTVARLNGIFAALGSLIALLFCALVHRMFCHLADRRTALLKIEKLNVELVERVRQLESLNDQLKLARDQALESNKVKSEFLMNISHELRTPLCAVLGLSEYLAGNALDEDSEHTVSVIKDSAQKLLRQIDDLLEFSCLESGLVRLERTRFSLPSIVAEVGSSVSADAIAKGLFLNISVDRNVPAEVWGDERRVRLVLFHLASNAVKFTQSGSISITTQAIFTGPDKVLMRFSVADTGIGISEEVQPRLFQPFVQADGSTKRKFGGVGIGLSLSKSLATLMGGHITMSSQEGKGSEFSLTVPLEVAAIACPAISRHDEATPNHQG